MIADVTQAMSFGQVASPGGGANIVQMLASPLIKNAYYDIHLLLYIDGTPAAATDDDNMQFYSLSRGISAQQLIVPSNGQVVQYTFRDINNGGGISAAVTARNAATAGAVYHASMQFNLVDNIATY